jgi:hypothetical protein
MRIEHKLQDPLVTATDVDRPNYAFGVMLDAADFVAEQTYHRGRLARALAALHGSGTVAGLAVRHVPGVAAAPGVDGRAEEIEVTAGLAIDGRGRLIDVASDRCIEVPRWWAAQSDDALAAAFKDALDGVVADVFVRFVACGRGRTPAIAHGPADALDASTYARVRDGFELRLVPRPEDAPPLPDDPWAAIAGATLAERLTSMHDAVLARHARLTERRDRLVAPATLDRGLDWLLLARLVFPATRPGGGRPVRGDDPPAIDNHVRSFVVGSDALRRVLAP